MLAALQAFPRCFHADQAGLVVLDVGVEYAHGIRATAHTGNHCVGLLGFAAGGCQHLGHLYQTLVADDALKVADHHGVGVWACHGTDDVKGVVHVGDPVAHGFVERVFQGLAAALYRHHGGAQQLHAVDVRALAFHVFAAHVHHAFQSVAGANGGCGHTVLAGAGFGNHAGLAHALGEHRLADGVVDLVGAGMVQVFALQEDLCTTHFAAHPGCVVHGGRAAYKVGQF